MNWFVTSLRENPELAIFLTLAVGFVIGRVRIGSFSLGNVVGTLLAGVLVGQLDVKIDPLVKMVFFALFLFATGYKVGPQFFRGLKKNALSQALLTLVLCVVQPGRRPWWRRRSWATTRHRGRACSPGPSPSRRSSAPPATPSRASACPRPRRRGCSTTSPWPTR